jgi:hypothetical protein
MVVFNPTDGRVAPLPCIGTEPASDLSHAALVSADDYIFLLGGETQFRHIHLYALDVERQWWFAFHARPDGETLQATDGLVNRQGLLMLPSEHSHSHRWSIFDCDPASRRRFTFFQFARDSNHSNFLTRVSNKPRRLPQVLAGSVSENCSFF